MASGNKYAFEVNKFKDNEKILDSFEDNISIVEEDSSQVAFESKQFRKLASGLNCTQGPWLNNAAGGLRELTISSRSIVRRRKESG